jgi:hypothetical protein
LHRAARKCGRRYFGRGAGSGDDDSSAREYAR